jgi:hypothetical protein
LNAQSIGVAKMLECAKYFTTKLPGMRKVPLLRRCCFCRKRNKKGGLYAALMLIEMPNVSLARLL